jgi:hypothetical protein
MSRTLRLLAAVCAFWLVAACEESLTVLGPTSPDQGIVIFIHSNFQGPSQGIDADVSDLGDVEGPCTSGAEGEQPTWHDCVSSVRVMAGWRATLYRDKDFKGESMVLEADAANLRDMRGPCDDSFNDCISSIRVTRK